MISVLRLRLSPKNWGRLIDLADAEGVSPTVLAKRIISDHLSREGS